MPDPRWAAAASYTLGNFVSGRGVLQGGRLGVEFMGAHLRITLAYGIYPGQNAYGENASIRLRRHPVDLDLGYATHEHYRLRWIAEGFVAGDWTSRRTSLAKSPLSSQPDAGFFLVSLGARGRQELRLFRHLALGLGLGMDVLLNPVTFQSVKATSAETVARLARVRYSVELGLKVSAF